MMIDFAYIDSICPGWSKRPQQECFGILLADEKVHDILILGVYHGRDIAYCAAMLRETGREGKITGVDCFLPHVDYHLPPSEEAARSNLEELGFGDMIEIVCADAEEFCQQAAAEGRSWDVVYVDTDHRENPTLRHIRAAVPLVRPGGWIAGDDYPPIYEHWGVNRAVDALFQKFDLIFGWCWIARPEDYRWPEEKPNSEPGSGSEP